MFGSFVKKTARHSTCIPACAALLSILCAAGCNAPGSFKVTPISSDKSLEETVIRSGGAFVSDRIAIIDISGVIMNGRIKGLFTEGENPVSLTVEQLHKAASDKRVKAVILRINSPGGGVTASDMLHYEIARFRKQTGKPVVAYFQDVAASGAYYLACASDEIMAQRTSVTGSIGVIMLMVNMKGTLDYIGVHTDAITSGAYKDAGSPFRTMTPDERKLFQVMVNDFYGQFVDAVDAGRPNLNRDQVLSLADGRVYTAHQALSNGLIDEIGTFDDAIRVACARAGVEKANVVRYHRPMAWVPNAYAAAQDRPFSPSTINLLNIDVSTMWTRHPQFMYIWCVR